MKRALVLLLLLAVVGGAATAWWYFGHETGESQLKLFGNVDLRQVELAFNNSQRIREVLVHEGDHVKKDQVLARLDTSRLEPQVAQAEAQAAAQQQIVERLHSGSRPEEIAQARANLASAQADAANAVRQYDRLQAIAKESSGGAVSQQDLDNAKAAQQVMDAKVKVNENALELAIAGPRKEEIAEAEAQLRATQAQLAYLKQELDDAVLVAPTDAVVRTRVMEPGEMASPMRPVLLLAILDPKWIRAYVSEVDLGKLKPGMKTEITVDSFPGRRFEGWIGFISPVAEFTPKAVQTEELRTNLVYEVRAFVTDPQDELRLGMPATVSLAPQAKVADPESTRATRLPAGDGSPPEATPQSDEQPAAATSLEDAAPKGSAQDASPSAEQPASEKSSD